MFKKAVYVTAIAALIGAGLVNTFPARAQESNGDTNATTAYPDEYPNSMDEMMSGDHGPMTNGEYANMMSGNSGTMMTDEHMGSYMADMTDGDHSSMMNGDHGNMMRGDSNHDSIGGMMGGSTTPDNGPMNGR